MAEQVVSNEYDYESVEAAFGEEEPQTVPQSSAKKNRRMKKKKTAGKSDPRTSGVQPPKKRKKATRPEYPIHRRLSHEAGCKALHACCGGIECPHCDQLLFVDVDYIPRKYLKAALRYGHVKGVKERRGTISTAGKGERVLRLFRKEMYCKCTKHSNAVQKSDIQDELNQMSTGRRRRILREIQNSSPEPVIQQEAEVAHQYPAQVPLMRPQPMYHQQPFVMTSPMMMAPAMMSPSDHAGFISSPNYVPVQQQYGPFLEAPPLGFESHENVYWAPDTINYPPEFNYNHMGYHY